MFVNSDSSELITGNFDTDKSHPISKVSIAALNDTFLDYVVNYDEAYPWPATRRVLVE